MRPDFAKILVERERCGSSKSYRDVRDRESHLELVEDGEGIESEAPSRRSMSKPHIAHYQGKEFSENLNPLRKWLQKNVGRPWNKVYSELRQQFKPTNTINAHIYQHLFQYVELNAVVGDDGVARRATAWGGRYFSTVDLYVDQHGLLRKAKPGRRPRIPKAEPEYIAIDDSTAFAKVEGLWYRVALRLREIIGYTTTVGRSFSYKTEQWEKNDPRVNEHTVRGWPKTMVVVGRKQLSTKELKQHGLRNDP